MGRRRSFRSARGEVPDFDADAAAEQLYDELLARTRILAVVVPSLDDSMSSARTLQRLAGYARHVVARLRADPDATSCRHLAQLLWPHGTIPRDGHPWWSTPLGTIIGGERSAPERTAQAADGRSGADGA